MTDSYVILGYMNPDYLLGGDFPLNADKARRIYQEKVATILNRGVVEAAYGVYEIAIPISGARSPRCPPKGAGIRASFLFSFLVARRRCTELLLPGPSA